MILMLAHASFVLCYMCVTSNEPDSAHFGVIPRGLIPHTDCLQGDAGEPQAALDANGPDSGLALGGMTVTGNCNSSKCSNVEIKADGKCTPACEYNSYRQTIGESPALLPFGAWLICEPGGVQSKEGSSTMRW
jgi:hypothetical protein